MQKISKKQFLAIITGLLLISLLVWAGWFRKESSNSQVATGEKVISLQATLESAGLPGKEVLKSFASMDSLAPQKTNSGFEIKDSLQNSASDSTEKNDFKINFPANYKEHINLTLAPNKVITIIDKQASSAEGQLLADQNDQKNPAYVEYKLGKRKSIFYAYQKNQIGAQKLKNWILYQSGNGSESESYQFENAKIVLDSKNGNASVAFADKTENPTFALPLQIPKPFFIDKDGIRTELDWKLNEAGDTLSVELATTPDKYPIVLDPTIIPSQFSMIGTVSMKGAVKFVTNGERTAYVAPNPFAPVNTAIPPLFGTAATVGGTILAAPGVWTGYPTPTFTYQWQRGTAAISGATNSTYVAQSADAGSTLRVVVTGTNSVGNATGTSANTSAVTMAPANTAVPTISGTAAVSATLTATAGSWTGYPAPTFTYQWQRGTTAISGATNSTYVAQSADIGSTLRVVVTGTNSVGNATGTSANTSAVLFICGTSTIAGAGSITYGTVVGADGKCWLDRNLGAPNVATAFNNSANYGYLYQWGRGTDGHQITTSGTTSTLSSSDAPGHVSFILALNPPYDWRSGQNNNLWQGVSGINNPCPTGFRLPTQSEWAALVSAAGITNYSTAWSSTLKLTATGFRRDGSGSLDFQGAYGHYWSSSVTGSNAFTLCFDSGSVWPANVDTRAYGFSVRCVKD